MHSIKYKLATFTALLWIPSVQKWSSYESGKRFQNPTEKGVKKAAIKK